MKKLAVLTLTLSLILGLGLVGAGQDKEVITLKVMTTPHPGAPHYGYLGPVGTGETKEKMPEWYENSPVQIYEENHPNVDIKLDVDVVPKSNYTKQLYLAVSSNKKYDLVRVDEMQVAQLAATGYFTPQFSEDYEQWAEDKGLYENFVKGSTYDGKFYGILDRTGSRAIWVWKDVLHEAGYTMEDVSSAEGLLEALPEITETAKEEFGMSGGLEYPFDAGWVVDQSWGWLYQLGGSILEKNEEGEWEPGFNNEAGVKTLNYIKNLVDNGATLQRDWQWMLANFMDRKYAMTYEGSWAVSAITSKYPDKSHEELTDMIGVIPTTKFEGKELRALAGGWMWMIPRAAPNPDIAHEVIMTMLNNRESYAHMLVQEGNLPTSEWMFDAPQYKDMVTKDIPEPWYEQFRRGVAGGVHRPSLEQYSQIQKAFWDATQKVVVNDVPAEEALDAAAKQVRDILEG